jgi:hypothetical protein
MHDDNQINYFAETDSRNKRVRFGIKRADRSRHVYVIGKTGMGKSTLLENMAIQDIRNGEGFAFLDPHGKTAEMLLDYVPENRKNDILYFAPFDTDYPISFNVMEDVGPDRRHLVANGLMSAFKKIWVDAWSARMEYILNNILLALLEYPDSTLIGVNRMLADRDYRKKVVDNITDPSVRSFWLDEFAKYGERYMQEAGAAIQNKVGQFISNPLIRNIIGQPKSTFDLRKVMDERKIVIINLSKGRMGEANANLLGSMLITKIYLAAMSRAEASEHEMRSLPHFYLYVDEFQNFANESFADILSEARKYKLDLTIAHQYIEQMSEEVRAAVFGNIGTMICFRVGAYDAEVLEKEFAPQFTAEDLVNLGFVQIYLKLMIDGVSSSPFSATTLPPIERPIVSFKKDIIEYSRRTYARVRRDVEEAIKAWHEQSSASQFQSMPPRRQEGGRPPAAPRPTGADSRGRPPEQRFQSNQPRQFSEPSRSTENITRPQPSQPPRHQSRHTQPQETKEERIARETALRKAISLSQLKPQSEVKNDKKRPTERNIAELREALVSVMGDAILANKPKEEKPIEKAKEPEKPQPKKPEAETTKVETRMPPPKSAGNTKEVPEEVLRKILEIGK